MRGKVSNGSQQGSDAGITPAYAGKRVACQVFAVNFQDHPRVCGEKLLLLASIAPCSGSPPRMRGKVSEIKRRLTKAGITPAYAGKSPGTRQQAGASQDHPRVCGEKLSWRAASRLFAGSPPRMRGKVQLDNQAAGRVGITPAYAGKSPGR